MRVTIIVAINVVHVRTMAASEDDATIISTTDATELAVISAERMQLIVENVADEYRDAYYRDADCDGHEEMAHQLRTYIRVLRLLQWQLPDLVEMITETIELIAREYARLRS